MIILKHQPFDQVILLIGMIGMIEKTFWGLNKYYMRLVVKEFARYVVAELIA